MLVCVDLSYVCCVFCQSITKKRCCVANNFALFDEAVSKYAENHFQTVNNKDESKNNKDNT